MENDKPIGKRIDNLYTDDAGNVYDDKGVRQGRWIPADHAYWADRILNAEKKDGPWSAIKEMIAFWKHQNPTTYESMLMEVQELKQSRKSKTGGDKNMRYLADIPVQLWNMIIVFYGDKDKVDPYSKEFLREFSKRFPEFRVAERI